MTFSRLTRIPTASLTTCLAASAQGMEECQVTHTNTHSGSFVYNYCLICGSIGLWSCNEFGYIRRHLNTSEVFFYFHSERTVLCMRAYMQCGEKNKHVEISILIRGSITVHLIILNNYIKMQII